MFMSLQSSCAEILTPSVRWGLWGGCLDHEVRAVMNETSTHVRDLRELPCRVHHMRTGRGLSLDSRSASALILDF